MDAELLIDPPYVSRAARFMDQMRRYAPRGVRVTRSYLGQARTLVVYGQGSPARIPIVAKHRAKGGRVACFDLGYWDSARTMRVSIDGAHPTADMIGAGPRGGRRFPALREDGKAGGPILLVGMGRKSCAAHSYHPLQWERAKLRDLQARFAGRTIYWRPKGPIATPLEKLPLRHGCSIEDAIRGCGLVVARHSNVTVDAAVAGVPFECEDGAARWLLSREFSPANRREFLERLAWWQWRADEAAACWNFIRSMVK